MPIEDETGPPPSGESAGVESAQISAELLGKVVDKVLEMLLRDLRLERERLGASLGLQRRRGVG